MASKRKNLPSKFEVENTSNFDEDRIQLDNKIIKNKEINDHEKNKLKLCWILLLEQ